MYSGTSELFELNKIMFIYIITIMITVCMAIDFIYHNRQFRYPLFYSIALAFFFLTQTVSTFYSIDRHTSIVGYYGRFNGGLISITAYLLLFFGFIQYFDVKSVKRFLIVSVISSLGVILWGIPGRYGYDLSCLVFTGTFDNSCWTDQFRPAERMFSTLGQPNWLGAYLAVHFFVGIYFYLINILKSKLKTATAYIIYTVLVFIAILFTRSRSTMLSLAVALFFSPFAFIYCRKLISAPEFKKMTTALFAGILFTVLLFKTGIPQIDNLITLSAGKNVESLAPETTTRPDSGVTDSIDIRKIVWKGAIELGRRYPYFGTGLETFGYSYYFVRPPEHNLTSEWDFLYNKAHNEYLNYLATTGYFGLGAYLIVIIATITMIVVFVRNSYKSDRDEAGLLSLLMGSAYVTILVTNFFGFSTTTVQLFLYLTPAIIYSVSHVNSGFIADRREQRITHHILKGLVLSIGLYGIMYVTNAYRADIDYAYSDKLVRSGDYQQAASLYTDVLDRHYEHVYEDKLSFILANLAYGVSKSGEQETSARLVKLSRYYNEHSRSISHDNILYLKTAIKNAYLYYQIDQDPRILADSLSLFTEASKIAPTDPKIPYSESLFYSLLEDEEKDKDKKLDYAGNSLDAIDRAIKLKSNYYDAYFLKAQLLKKYNNKVEAKKLFQYIIDTFGEEEQVKKELESL